MKISKKASLFFLVVLFLMQAGFAYGLETNYPTIFGLSLGDDPTLPEYARYFFNIGILLAGFLAVIVIAWGGIQYLFTLGIGKLIDPKKGTRAPDEAKEWVKAGTLGLLLIVSAYLIAYTINPALVIFDLKGLAPLTFLANLFETPSPSLPIDIYYEIPIGILAENVVARQVDCYDFDGNGDPIPGDQIATDDGRNIFGPTYLEHDRTDCSIKLAETFEKKSNLANELAKKISELMATCSCAGNCETTWNPPCDAEPPCVGQATCGPQTKDCCSDETKEKIEHGPIVLDLDDGTKITFRGLDEFRSNNGYSTIKNIVEMQPQPKVGGKEITVMNIGADVCGTCDFNCPVCLPGDIACFEQKQTCKTDEANCRLEKMDCLKRNSPWHNLKLIDQLTYFEGKIGEIKQKVQFDLDNLEKGEGDLGRCYLADSYVDFLKLYENNDKDQKIISIQTAFPINPSKYCKGFEYENSTCYSQCQEQCPGTAKTEFDCYKGAANEGEIKDCWDKRTCLPGLSPFQNFSECMTSCEISCFDQCEQKSGQDRLKCQLACNDDSKCLEDNESACVVNFNSLKDCADPSGCISLCGGNVECEDSCRIKYNNPEFQKNCAQTSAALCTYGSDQNAGFPDCLKYPYSVSGNYSASFIYKNPASQICSNPNQIVLTGTTCQSQYPETAKCPSASACPECPCGITYEYLESGGGGGGVVCPPGECLGNDGICSPGNCESSGANYDYGSPSDYNDSYGGITSVELDHTVVNSNCEQVLFNDDPLTFYCNQTWWEKNISKDEKPLGESFTCAKEKEIPIGNTVDDAEKWARNFIGAINKFNQETYDMIRYLAGVGQEQDYCECGSKCGPIEFACQPKCEEGEKEIINDEGVVEGTEKICIRQDCIGNSCQKMIHILLGGSTGACQGEGVATYLNKVRQGLENFKGAVTGSERSDILKELEYSRKMVNTCSQDYSKEVRILNCTRVEDEIMPPIIGDTKPGKAIVNNQPAVSSYCYGQALGEVLGAGSVADNWFCCQAK